jgi:hypothetical protein
MQTSQNGWPAGTQQDADVTGFAVPGTKVVLPLNVDAGPSLVAFAADYHKHVQPLDPASCWGWADRNIRGSSTTISNHASGTAMDLNAAKHPLATPDLATFTAQQVATIHQLLTERAGFIRWGGDYHGRVDSMHFEINADPTVFDRWTGNVGDPSPILHLGSIGPKVADVQRALNKLGNHLVVDGYFGPTTETVLRKFQSNRRGAPLHLLVTGTADLPTWAALRAVAHPTK